VVVALALRGHGYGRILIAAAEKIAKMSVVHCVLVAAGCSELLR
jgi:hypothetical protein